MTIRFSKQSSENSIRLTTNTKLQNWDPKKTKDKPIFNFNANSQGSVSLGNVQEKLLLALAGGYCSGDCEDPDDIFTLTERDLKEAKRRFLEQDRSLFGNINVKEFRYDEKAGIANITTNSGDVLRVDLETESEKANAGQLSIGNQEHKNTQRNTIPQTVDKTKTTTSAQQSIKETGKIISKFKGGKISINAVHDLNSVSKYTGISARYIKDILVGIEGKNNWPLTTAEYDGVKDNTHPKGYLTIGFGHTSLTGEPIVYEGMVITEKQAYQILANDIMTATKYAKHYGGELYNKAPNSIKNAMIDLVYNKGPGAINQSLKANLSQGYYHSAALRTWYDTQNIGLQKRNMHRFIEACKNLNIKERKSAITRFRSEHLYDLINVYKKDGNAQAAWNAFCKQSKCKDQCF